MGAGSASCGPPLESRDVTRGPAIAAGRAEVRRLEREEANLHAALRLATGGTMGSLMGALEAIATELAAARARLAAVNQRERMVKANPPMVAETLAKLQGIFATSNFVERVA